MDGRLSGGFRRLMLGVRLQPKMLSENAQLYEEARAAKLGNAKLPDILDLLRHWMDEHYSVNVLHIVYDNSDLGRRANRPRLNLILETAHDFAQLHHGPTVPPQVKKAILKRFSTIVAESDSQQVYDTEDVYLTFDVFSNEAMTQAVARFFENDAKHLVDQFAKCHVWDIINGGGWCIVVFYMTDEDVHSNAANGSSHAITQRCYELVKSYDEFDYFAPRDLRVEFNSKEYLDANFEGHLYRYFK